MLISFDGRIFSRGLFRAIGPVESEAEEDMFLGSGVFFFPCMKDVSADDMCWNCCKMGLLQ